MREWNTDDADHTDKSIRTGIRPILSHSVKIRVIRVIRVLKFFAAGKDYPAISTAVQYNISVPKARSS